MQQRFRAHRRGGHAGERLAVLNRGETKHSCAACFFPKALTMTATPRERKPDALTFKSSHAFFHFAFTSLALFVSCVFLSMQRCRVTVPPRKFPLWIVFSVSSKENVSVCLCMAHVYTTDKVSEASSSSRGSRESGGVRPKSSMTSTDRTLSGL